MGWEWKGKRVSFNRLARRASIPLATAAALIYLSAAPGVTGIRKSSSTTKEPSGPNPPSLSWTPCEDNAECATLSVPLDYAHSNGKKIEIALLRTRAGDPSRRIGSLLVNPGGPGDGGRMLPLSLRNAALRAGGSDAEIFSRFDVVGFDPRGVGESTSISCGDAIKSYERADFTPTNKAEDKALVDETQKFVRACQQRSGQLLKFVDTTSAARDMDQIRLALGESTISYLGFSYGTELGAVYADRFPKRVRAFVLDGAVDPKQYLGGVASVRDQTQSIDKAFQAFASDCAARPDCRFYSGGDPAAGFDALVQSLDKQPLAASSQPGRSITQNQLVATTALVLSGFPETRGLLETVLAQAQAGDASSVASTYDNVFEIEPDGARTNLLEANTAIVCLDSRWPRGAAGYNALITRLQKESPRFSQTFQAGQLPCVYWPVKPKPPRAPEAKGASPIVVVGSTGDPLTPFADAQAMAKQLSSGVLLTREGPGHTAFGKSRCIDDAVAAYLIDLQVPALGTTCT
jgi:pimeloyl-ACP methyl ester carboxylesterase